MGEVSFPMGYFWGSRSAEGRSVSLPGALRQQVVEQDRRFLNWEEVLVVIDFRSWDENRFHIRATRKGWAAPQWCFPVPESCPN